MWFFSSPAIVFGDGALGNLETIQGHCACIVTDANIVKLGYVELVKSALAATGMEFCVIDNVEPDPSLETVKAGAARMLETKPDWIIALGGGSVMDAAKGMWILYEHPNFDPESINPIDVIGLRIKARLIAIPTTAGTGSETTWAIVLTNHAEQRKLGLGNREAVPDIAILDPEFIRELPPRVTSETGLDALTHAIEGYTSTYANDFCDGLCLQAAKLVFDYLPRCYHDGLDMEARTHMQNAAAIAGLGFGNSMAALAHGMGHALGGALHVPHGRAVALFLPYTIEYCARGQGTRYIAMARFLGLEAANETEAAANLVEAIRKLEQGISQPLSLSEAGIDKAAFERELDHLISNAMNDTQTIMATRVPEEDDLRKLFTYAYSGKKVDF
jgi:alcohol dehydrogenase class IV